MALEPGTKLSTTERRQLAADVSDMVAQEQAQEMSPQQQLDAWTAQATRQHSSRDANCPGVPRYGHGEGDA